MVSSYRPRVAIVVPIWPAILVGVALLVMAGLPHPALAQAVQESEIFPRPARG